MYLGYVTDIEGIKVGHMESQEGLTGCSVIICEEGASGGVDVRGSAPGTRETDLLQAEKMVDKIHAVVLAGGSAFGLDAASGVMKYLEENSIGLDVGVTKVPIVPSAVIFDLGLGDFRIRPDKEMGYQAAKNASKEENRQGNVGAGIGASIGKIMGPLFSMKSGLGSATVSLGDLKVSALVVVNAFGDIYDFENKRQIAGVYDKTNKKLLSTVDIIKGMNKELSFNGQNTTIGLIVTNGILTKAGANKVSQMAHNGYAKTINPVHTMLDGDTIFTMATNKVKADINLIGILAVEAMSKAIINGVKSADDLGGLISFKNLQFPIE